MLFSLTNGNASSLRADFNQARYIDLSYINPARAPLPLHSTFPFFLFPAPHFGRITLMMLSTVRSTALRGMFDSSLLSLQLTPTAKPLTAIVPYCNTQTAWISYSSSKPASPEPHIEKPVLAVPGPGGPTLTRRTKAEVPLPSQEGNNGAIQYAL